jgi:uncharacterized protein YndB with AHSA1/START domain
MEKKISVTRVFNAPVKLVWQTWVDPELVMRWWGPAGFTAPVAKIDFREGGTSLVCMRAPASFGGQDFFSIWEYTKIVPLQSIEFIQNLADKEGTKINPVNVGMPPDFPEDIRTVVRFKDLGNNKTELTVTEFADMGLTTEFAIKGLQQSLEKMDTIFIDLQNT